jgi:hypothetical protein
MLMILFLAVGGIMVLVLILLAVVVAAIKQEPRGEEFTSRPPSAVTAWVRRLLGVYVRRPNQPLISSQEHEELCCTPCDPPRWPRGSAQ